MNKPDLEILDQDELHRFLFSSDYRSSKNEAKISAFFPQPVYPNELSVYIQKSLTLNQMWQICDTYVGIYRNGRECKASAILEAGRVKEIYNDHQSKYLNLELLNEPHPHHVNIVNISPSSAGEILVAEKLLQLSKCIKR